VFKKQKKNRVIKYAENYASCRGFFVELDLLTLPSIIIKQNWIYQKENLNSFMTNITSTQYDSRNRKMLPPSKNGTDNFQINIFNHLPKKI